MEEVDEPAAGRTAGRFALSAGDREPSRDDRHFLSTVSGRSGAIKVRRTPHLTNAWGQILSPGRTSLDLSLTGRRVGGYRERTVDRVRGGSACWTRTGSASSKARFFTGSSRHGLRRGHRAIKVKTALTLLLSYPCYRAETTWSPMGADGSAARIVYLTFILQYGVLVIPRYLARFE
jgi:hypothetical protein